MLVRILPLVLGLALASCGSAEVDSTGGQAEMQAEPLAAGETSQSADPQAQVAPQIAYVYGFTFRLPRDQMARTQERHLQLCEQLGSSRCRVRKMERSAGEGDYANGALSLSVAAPLARLFGDRLASAVSQAGGETADRSIDAEDLSKQIVDTDARIRTKEALVRRLTVLLDNRSGNIAQAVEAERAINQAQEELEQARAWVAQMRLRVAMSTIAIRYESSGTLGVGFVEPLSDSFRVMGSLLGRSLAALIQLLALLLPWLLLGVIIWYGVARARRFLQSQRPHAISDHSQAEGESSGG